MNKLVSMISHMGVIGLALLALVIATVVWLFEDFHRATSGPAAIAGSDAPWLEAELRGDALPTSAPLICEDEISGDRSML